MTIRLHPATRHGSVLHRLMSVGADPRTATTFCGIQFAWGYVPPKTGEMPHCEECFR